MTVSTKGLQHYYWNGRWKTFSSERRRCWTNGVLMIGWLCSRRTRATWSRRPTCLLPIRRRPWQSSMTIWPAARTGRAIEEPPCSSRISLVPHPSFYHQREDQGDCRGRNPGERVVSGVPHTQRTSRSAHRELRLHLKAG